MVGDRITNLPGNVTDHILKCLPLRDAVRTSILSRSWRHKWVTVPNLVFNDFELGKSKCPELIVSHMLLLHRGSIVKFSLSNNLIFNHFAVDQWLHFLSNHCIEDLKLSCPRLNTPLYKIPYVVFSYAHLRRLTLCRVAVELPPKFQGFSRLDELDLCNVVIALTDFQMLISKSPMLEVLSISNEYDSFICLHPSLPLYEIPHTVFSLDRLKHLNLRRVDIKLPHNFQGFSGLVELNLVNVCIVSPDLQRLISKCPMLKFLSIITRDILTVYCLDIDAGNLKVLKLVGLFYPILLKTPNLEELSIEYGDLSCLHERGIGFEDVELPRLNGGVANFIKFFGQLPSLKKLTGGHLFLQFLAIGGIPHDLPNKLDHLTHLSLELINFAILDNVSSAICLIRNSPNLESLHIEFEPCENWVWPRNMSTKKKNQQRLKAATLLKAERKCGILLKHLNTVAISECNGFETEVEFIKLLLSTSKGNILKSFEVGFHDGLMDDDYDVRMLAVDELKRFHQASCEGVPLQILE